MNFDTDNFFAFLERPESYPFLALLTVAFLLGILMGLVLRGRRVRMLRKELKEKDKEINELRVSVDTLNEQMALKEADLKKASLENDDLKTRIQVLESNNRQLQTDLEVSLDHIKRLELSNQSYKDDMTRMKTQLSSKPTSTVSYEDTTPVVASSGISTDSDSGQQIGELQNLYSQTRSRLELLEDKINRLEAENTVLQEDLQKITAKAELAPEEMDQHITLAQPKNAEVIGSRIVTDGSLEKDDLTLINGVGPFLEKKLNQAGVFTYQQISDWDKTTIEQVTRKIGFFPGRIEQDNWVGQAARLLQMKAENPKAFTKEEVHPSNPKDLKIIAGIGPKTEVLLKNNGVRNWVELASTDVERLRAILRDAGAPFDTLNPSTWPEQARLASNGEWERFEDYQGYLGVD